MNSGFLQSLRAKDRKLDKEFWIDYLKDLDVNANRDIVALTWAVDYDDVTHDILVHYEVSVSEPDTYLLQIWVMDQADGLWIPELQPRETCVVEFSPADGITKCKGGLFDHKWRPEDSGRKYFAYVWGYVIQSGKVVQFGPYQQEFIYP